MRHFIIAWLILSSSIITGALPANVELEADNIEYSNNKKHLVAKQNVSLEYRDYAIHTDHFILNTELSETIFPGPLTLQRNHQQIYAQQLNYNFKTYKGNALGLEATIARLNIKGKEVLFRPEKMMVSHSEFTTCPNDNHYKITAESIDIYYPLGFFVAKNSRFYFKYLPFTIPIPYYIYGRRDSALFGASSLLPEFGQNNVEGNYGQYKSSYVANPKLSGTGDIGLTEKLGWVIGGSNIYQHNSRLRLGAQYHAYPQESLTSMMLVGKLAIPLYHTLSNSDNFLDNFVNQFGNNARLPETELELKVQKHGITNDYWVSQYPLTQLHYKQLSFLQLQANGKVGARYAEETDLKDYNFNAKQIFIQGTTGYKGIAFKKAEFGIDLTHSLNKYSNNQHWARIFIITSIPIEMILNPELRYLKRIMNDGKSPFQYEDAYTYLSDEIGIVLSQNINQLKFRSSAYYILDTDTFREMDFSLDMVFHCWGLGITWKTKQKAFNFRFNLY